VEKNYFGSAKSLFNLLTVCKHNKFFKISSLLKMMFFIPLIPSYFGIAQWDLGSSFFFSNPQERRPTAAAHWQRSVSSRDFLEN
jgi:hypothetical protein